MEPHELPQAHHRSTSLVCCLAFSAALAVLAAGSGRAAAQTVTVTSYGGQIPSRIGNLPVRSGTEWCPGTGVGQIFRTPDNVSTLLSSFSIMASLPPEFFLATPVPLEVSLFEWNGLSLVGPAIATSAPATPVHTGTLIGDQLAFAFDVNLDPTKTYLALVAGTAVAPRGFDGGPSFDYCLPPMPLFLGLQCVLPRHLSKREHGYIRVARGPVTGEITDDIQSPPLTDPGRDLIFTATFNAPVTATPEPAA